MYTSAQYAADCTEQSTRSTPLCSSKHETSDVSQQRACQWRLSTTKVITVRDQDARVAAPGAGVRINPKKASSTASSPSTGGTGFTRHTGSALPQPRAQATVTCVGESPQQQQLLRHSAMSECMDIGSGNTGGHYSMRLQYTWQSGWYVEYVASTHCRCRAAQWSAQQIRQRTHLQCVETVLAPLPARCWQSSCPQVAGRLPPADRMQQD